MPNKSPILQRNSNHPEMTDLIFWFKIKGFFIVRWIKKTFKLKKNMENQFADRIRQLVLDKVDFKNDDAEAIVESISTAALELDEATDTFVGLAGGNADLEDMAGALVDLADIFDGAKLDADKSAKLDVTVDKLLKGTGSEDQRVALKDVFTKTMAYQVTAKAANEFFDLLLATDPD